MTWQEERVIFRDIAYDSLRLIFDGKDVTRVRGVTTQLGGYQLVRPFGYGPATFAFPGVTDLDEPGVGDIWWLHNEAPARLVPVVDGVLGEDLWRGFVSLVDTTEDGTVEVTCAGDATGRLEARIKPTTLFDREDDAGRLMFGALKTCGIKLWPRLGSVTGIERSTQGEGTGTYLAHVEALLSSLGDDWTVDPVWVDGQHRYQMVEVDTTTVHATVFWGTDGVKGRLSDDLFERPNTIYCTAITPQGQKYVGAKAPGMFQGQPAPFPGVLAEGANGDDVTVLENRLLAVGPLELEDTGPGGFDDATVDAVEWVQEQAGLPVTGIVDEATWNACYDLSVTGLSLFPGLVLPFAQASRVREWNRTATGAIASRNPDWDEDAIQVDALQDHGVAKKRRVRKSAKRQVERNETGDNLVGTIDFTGADVFAGDVTHATPGKTILPATRLKPGMNLRLRGYRGGHPVVTLVGANVDSNLDVHTAADSKARPVHTVGEIIAANKDTRTSPRRDFIRAVRNRPAAIDNQIIWSELGGRIGVATPLTGGRWNRVEIVMGQNGEVLKTRIKTSIPTRFAAGFFARDTAPEMLDARAGDPTSAASAWHTAAFQHEMRETHLMMHAIGQHRQMAGYAPGQQTGDDNEPTGDPVTGLHIDYMTWPYQMFKDPAAYLLIWVENDCTLDPGPAGKILWHLESEGA